MNRTLLLIAMALLAAAACKKETITTSKDARLLTSSDTLYFDTVFTARGSVTKQVRIINPNEQGIRISNLSLVGGSGSAYQINVNGTPGISFSNLELDAGDSLYVFVRVNVDPTSDNSPFLVKDSLLIESNGNTSKVQLVAYGQNANYIASGRITTNTTWTNTRPYVITGPLVVDTNAILTIEEGCRIYCNATAPIIVNGSLQTIGDRFDSTRISFRADRLDEPYKDLPGSWPGIVFNTISRNNVLRYTNILNAYQAIVVGGGAAQLPAKLTMSHCIIDNAYDLGLFAFNTSIDATNCQFTQIGNEGLPGNGGSNVIISGGGNINFNHCTLATFANFYQNHKQPVLYITNSTGTGAANLNMLISNTIIFGQSGFTEDELVTAPAAGAAFNVQLRNVLYKAKNDPSGISVSESLRNQDPLFDTINTSLRLYNYRLRSNSPCVDAGINTTANTDLDGLPRPVGTRPDMGAYEKQ
jgi:hypothetical protein